MSPYLFAKIVFEGIFRIAFSLELQSVEISAIMITWSAHKSTSAKYVST